MLTRSVALGMLLGAAALVTVGCGPTLTHEKFSMIQQGVDDREDVRHVLGKPRFSTDAEWYWEDRDRHVAARVFFDDDGRVSGKEWMDAKHGQWEGRHPQAAEPPPGEVRERSTKTRRIDED